MDCEFAARRPKCVLRARGNRLARTRARLRRTCAKQRRRIGRTCASPPCEDSCSSSCASLKRAFVDRPLIISRPAAVSSARQAGPSPLGGSEPCNKKQPESSRMPQYYALRTHTHTQARCLYKGRGETGVLRVQTAAAPACSLVVVANLLFFAGLVCRRGRAGGELRQHIREAER